MGPKKLHDTRGTSSLDGAELIQLWKINAFLVRITIDLRSTVHGCVACAEIVNVHTGTVSTLIENHADSWYHQAKSPDFGQYEVMEVVAATLAVDADAVLRAMYGDNDEAGA